MRVKCSSAFYDLVHEPARVLSLAKSAASRLKNQWLISPPGDLQPHPKGFRLTRLCFLLSSFCIVSKVLCIKVMR